MPLATDRLAAERPTPGLATDSVLPQDGNINESSSATAHAQLAVVLYDSGSVENDEDDLAALRALDLSVEELLRVFRGEEPLRVRAKSGALPAVASTKDPK